MASSPDAYPSLAKQPDLENPGQFFLAIEFIRSTTAAVVLSLDGASDLASWGDEPFTLEIVEDFGDGRERVRLVSTISLLPDERFFLRLNATLP